MDPVSEINDDDDDDDDDDDWLIFENIYTNLAKSIYLQCSEPLHVQSKNAHIH